LISPKSGSILGIGEIETDERKISDQISSSPFVRNLSKLNLSESRLNFYIEAVKNYNSKHHFWLGFSVERLTQFLLEVNDISDAAIFPDLLSMPPIQLLTE